MNILIIDDHAIIEEGLKQRILKVLPDAKFYFTDNIRNSISIVNSIEIQLIFCDLEFNNSDITDGFDICERILKMKPKMKLIAHTNYNSYRVMKKVQNSGFMSFLYKGSNFQDFFDTIHNVINIGKYESASIKNLLKKRNSVLLNLFNDSLYGISNLSKRELELTILLKDTTDRKELAKIMGNTPSTIDSYLQHIITKLNLKNRNDVALFSLEFQNELLKYQN
ncbi:DNA-binding NarL/FixJ family response regulator [Lutibacter sp. Hel_I_33_5]|uniref:response regulator transcription factor n=1 Tax=Lutibacter sp. Hel_I_33_5 TaxID=1566289 RepID=UPI0011A4E88B|nr:response regulator transcription factor [Lutibacter sp. Hel_I_33_5]TVZ56951.1 DNA-binding NarL/FixJ family response regulator [Lutibacter sp. Hel_I_33_5]